MFGFIREAITDVLHLHHSDFFIVPTAAHYENELEAYSVVLLYCFTCKCYPVVFTTFVSLAVKDTVITSSVSTSFITLPYASEKAERFSSTQALLQACKGKQPNFNKYTSYTHMQACNVNTNKQMNLNSTVF